ncbi:MAG: gluconate 2-dehydrogenase subunit 3 family protein [Cyclobacteriaceae bacterium]|nr:gluconate 2-dehydrogenase subunit 3 family protein [Cyclobacteriaceae bacterium]
MNRRDALSLTALTLGGTIIGSEMFLSGCTSKKTLPTGQADALLLDEVGETILPETADSPGAKAANIGEFMFTIVNDCYNPEEEKLFFDGLKKLEETASQQYSSNFAALSAEDKHELLLALDKEAKEEGKVHYFTMLKQLTIWGYFTSEPGCTKALRYNPVPGRYEGCIPYEKGDKAWG